MNEPTRDELYEVIAIQAVEIIALKDRVNTLRNLRRYDEERIAELEKSPNLYQDESGEQWEKVDSLEADVSETEKSRLELWRKVIGLNASKEECESKTISADEMSKEAQNG